MYHSRTNERYGVSTHGSLAGADSTDNASFNSILAVSTHGSLAGADILYLVWAPGHGFQLTAPLREPTGICSGREYTSSVSTHGSLAGADGYLFTSLL